MNYKNIFSFTLLCALVASISLTTKAMEFEGKQEKGNEEDKNSKAMETTETIDPSAEMTDASSIQSEEQKDELILSQFKQLLNTRYKDTDFADDKSSVELQELIELVSCVPKPLQDKVTNIVSEILQVRTCSALAQLLDGYRDRVGHLTQNNILAETQKTLTTGPDYVSKRGASIWEAMNYLAGVIVFGYFTKHISNTRD